MSALQRACWFAIAAVALSSCNFNRDEHPQFCNAEHPCASNERCVQSFCVRMDEGSGGRDAGVDSGRPPTDGGMQGEPCQEGQEPEPCYGGAANTEDVGMCRGGERACLNGFYTPCLGQVLPAADVCNEADDDCDGTTDEVEASCPATGTGLPGICNEGALVCVGSVPVCSPVNESQNEVCNGLDDDCDRATDEIVSVACFPSGASGCEANQDGTFSCKGLCSTGMSACDEGEVTCEDAVVAMGAEICTTGTDKAADDDCDDKIDEGCTCTTGAVRPCYGGPSGTDMYPPCQQGTQTCVAQRWGECQGQTLPQEETCQNQGRDDDCNGARDDIDSELGELGAPCIDDDQQGICRDGTIQCGSDDALPVCVGQPPQEELCDDIDQNCNGEDYDGFDLNTNENCGECGNRCDNGTSCCNLECRSQADFRHDEDNCGSCGHECGDGYYCCWNDCIREGGSGSPGTFGGGAGGGPQLPPRDDVCGCTADCRDLTCCGTSCVDLMNDNRNCGTCGNNCSSSGTVGLTCCNGFCSNFCVDPI
jgi:hypothetical protein